LDNGAGSFLDGADNDAEFVSCLETLGCNLGACGCNMFGVLEFLSTTLGIDLQKKKKNNNAVLFAIYGCWIQKNTKETLKLPYTFHLICAKTSV